MVGVAVKFTVVFSQIVVADAAMLTDGVISDVTNMVIVLDVTVDCVAQDRLDVITTFTWSPFANPDGWNVGLFVPTLLLFSFH